MSQPFNHWVNGVFVDGPPLPELDEPARRRRPERARPRIADHTRHRHASPGAAKIRAHRQRQRAGLIVLRVPILQFETVQYLVSTGRLSISQALDNRQVGRAIGEIVTELADRWKSVTG